MRIPSEAKMRAQARAFAAKNFHVPDDLAAAYNEACAERERVNVRISALWDERRRENNMSEDSLQRIGEAYREQSIIAFRQDSLFRQILRLENLLADVRFLQLSKIKWAKKNYLRRFTKRYRP
jgi:hypothetical protein